MVEHRYVLAALVAYLASAALVILGKLCAEDTPPDGRRGTRAAGWAAE